MPLRAIVRLSEGRGQVVDIADALERLLAVESGRAAAEVALRLFALRSEQDEFALADRALEVGLRADPNSRDLLELLMKRYGSRGAYRELSAFLGQVFEGAPENHPLLGALLEAHDKAGELDASVRAVSLALEKSPKAATLYRERAVRYEAGGDSGAALRDFERAFSFGDLAFLDDFVRALEREAVRLEPPEDRPVKLELARVLSGSGLVDAARAHLSELLKRDPKDDAALRGLANLEMDAERWDAASAAFRRLLPLEQGPALVEVALKLADACERAGRGADARSGLERAVKAVPAHPIARARLRELYEKTGADGPLARLMLEDAESEGNVSGRFDLLLKAAKLLLGQEGDPEQAVQVLEQARTLRPEDDEGILLLARSYAAYQRDSDALALLHAAIALRKGRRSKPLASMHREIARIHQKAGDKTGALDALTRSFDMDLHNGEVALELGLLARELDQQEVAARAFRSVTFMKQVPPGNFDGATAAARGLSYFYLGQMAKDKGDYKKARLMAQKAVMEDPSLDDAKTLLDELKTA
jgi:tetratricopeptide (TPR) repeat protein